MSDLRAALTTIIALADGMDPDQPLLGHWRKQVLQIARAALAATPEPGAGLRAEAHWKARAEALVMALERADDALNMRGDRIAAHIHMVEAIEADDRAALEFATADHDARDAVAEVEFRKPIKP